MYSSLMLLLYLRSLLCCASCLILSDCVLSQHSTCNQASHSILYCILDTPFCIASFFSFARVSIIHCLFYFSLLSVRPPDTWLATSPRLEAQALSWQSRGSPWRGGRSTEVSSCWQWALNRQTSHNNWACPHPYPYFIETSFCLIITTRTIIPSVQCGE